MKSKNRTYAWRLARVAVFLIATTTGCMTAPGGYMLPRGDLALELGLSFALIDNDVMTEHMVGFTALPLPIPVDPVIGVRYAPGESINIGLKLHPIALFAAIAHLEGYAVLNLIEQSERLPGLNLYLNLPFSISLRKAEARFYPGLGIALPYQTESWSLFMAGEAYFDPYFNKMSTSPVKGNFFVGADGRFPDSDWWMGGVFGLTTIGRYSNFSDSWLGNPFATLTSRYAFSP